MNGALSGRTILITRSKRQAPELRELLEARGATVLEVPTISIRPRQSPELDESIRELATYDWLMFTSVNGVEVFLERAKVLAASETSELPRTCCIGPATARRVQEYGYQVDLLPQLYQAEGILEEFLDLHGRRIEGLRILLPRASQAREILPEVLRQQGAEVTVIPVYDTVAPEEGKPALQAALQGAPPDLVTFTSSSTVRNFHALAIDAEIDLTQLRCAAIGPITASTAAELGFEVVVQPGKSTIPDLVDAIEQHLAVS